ncbi:MAG: peptidase [Acidobacteriota bacterium]
MKLGLLSILLIALLACDGAEAPQTELESAQPLHVVDDIEWRLAQFAPTDLTADISHLSENDRQVLADLVAAATIMDEIFLRQVWMGNPEMRQRLAGEADEATREYFRVNFGPWDRIAELKPFIGDMPHPDGAGYYPVDMSRDELSTWIEAHPDQRQALTSLHTVVRRRHSELVAVPYSEAYAEWLDPAADLLRRAAERTDNESLRTFLNLRADAFGSDDYFASDMAWMDLESPIEITIGPYETYEDKLFGYRAAFEGFVTVDIPAESAALARFKEMLPFLERNLPIDDHYKNLDRGTESPIRVVDVVFVGGDSKAGVQTLAFNLPNDERVREAKGSKKVMLRNVLRAKYEKILTPIAEQVLAAEDAARISFEAFFNRALHHELSHGLGPGNITIDGRATEVRRELKDLYSVMEEAKADVMGVYNIFALVEQGEMPDDIIDSLGPTFVADLFRSARFGVTEAHGQGTVSQFNYMLENGALEIDDSGKFRAIPERFPDVISDLLAEMLVLQATGDYEGTERFLETYGHPSAELLAAVERLDAVPVDIRPRYPTAEEL